MNRQLTTLYVIMGAAIRGLFDAGESPESIIEAADSAVNACVNPDPALAQAGKQFAEIAKERRELHRNDTD